MAINIPNIGTESVRETGRFTQVWFRFLSDLVTFVNNQPVTLDFAGTPEGNVIGRFKDQCWDTDNDVLYFKSTATGNTGWVALN